jgi:phosphoheptose isomerase
MACGTPVVGSHVGGIKFTVRDGETGYLVPPRDPAALADRLVYLLRNPSLLAHFGQAGIRRANSLFTWQAQAKSTAELYDHVNGLAGRHLRTSPHLVIDQGFAAGMDTLQLSRRLLQADILAAADAIGHGFVRGQKVLVCGNGGSAAEAQHMTAELVGRFKAAARGPLPALALTADGSILTAVGNDLGYDDVFARQVRAFGQPGDILIGISTSGNSPNVVRAFEAARERGMTCVAMLGKDGGELLPLADYAMVVPSGDTQRIQEVHVLVLHLLCELIEATVTDHLPVETPASLAAARGEAPVMSGGNGWANGKTNGKTNGKVNGHNGKNGPPPGGTFPIEPSLGGHRQHTASAD